MNMSEYRIIPIFNQSAPGVWDDFLRIRSATMTADYDMPLLAEDIAYAQKEYAHNWKSRSGNFAFGAFDQDNNMIGCVHGVVTQNVAHLGHLHVEPKYQGRRLGRRLLAAAQDAAAIMGARHIELISMSKARHFYEKMGYRGLSWTEYKKAVSGPRCVTAPVFYCKPALGRACGLTPDTVKQINKLHSPMFVSYDHQSNVNGYAVLDSNGGMLIQVRDNNPRQIVRHALEKQVSEYLAHMTALQR